MPVPSVEDMRTSHPAFSLVPDDMLSSALARAYRRSAGLSADDESIVEEAAMYLAAHLIASDPMAEPSARAAIRRDGGSTYYDRWLELVKQYRTFGSHIGVP